MRRQLEETGQPLIEPERNILQDAPENRMRQFMPQIGDDVIALPGEDFQLVVAADARLDEEVRAARRQVAILPLGMQILLVADLRVEEEHLHHGGARREFQLAEDLLRQGVELREKRIGLREFEIVIDNIVTATGVVLAGRGGGNDGSWWRGAAPPLPSAGEPTDLAAAARAASSRTPRRRRRTPRASRRRGSAAAKTTYPSPLPHGKVHSYRMRHRCGWSIFGRSRSVSSQFAGCIDLTC